MRIPDTIGIGKDEDEIEIKPEYEYAAVALITRNNKVIIEKRSVMAGDPWSGQFSLPGGHLSKHDALLKETAIRETLEETGVNLNEVGRYLGHFGPFVPKNKQNLRVYAYAFVLQKPVQLVPSKESEFLMWLDLSKVRATEGEHGNEFRFSKGTIWGLTARILEKFLELCEADTE